MYRVLLAFSIADEGGRDTSVPTDDPITFSLRAATT